MNEHEAQRIAAAANALRPDWPTSSVLTLIRKNLMDRPRRDVAVAIAWIACETNTANPARVLAIGPWWKAAGVEGSTHRREVLNPAERCGICSERQERCRAIWADDHEFEADIKKPTTADVPRIVQALKAEVAHTPVEAPRKTLDEYARNPQVQVLRDALHPELEESA